MHIAPHYLHTSRIGSSEGLKCDNQVCTITPLRRRIARETSTLNVLIKYTTVKRLDQKMELYLTSCSGSLLSTVLAPGQSPTQAQAIKAGQLYIRIVI